ncbi:MAG: hypothetical protein A2Y10_17920 [Planctomycetes bacterium GWF2_41_51]|nr:MAG: hypothetical protein A2Y10_17920 [Planctomycetes bacterium GWF2_41_51]HBG25870.1 hypothetical protein [Phycisphaerales bacterium]
MRTKSYGGLIIALGICIGFVAQKAQAGFILSGNREVLTSIKNFELKLVMDHNDKAIYGLKYEGVEKNIKLAFGAYGIKVFSITDDMPIKEMSKLSLSEETAVLYVRIDDIWPLILNGQKWCTYKIQLFILQHISLSREPTKRFEAITWEDIYTNFCIEDKFVYTVENALDKRLDFLIKDYLAANQKK